MIVNLHAQLNMLGGLMVILMGVALALLVGRGVRSRPRLVRTTLVGVVAGMGVYYTAGMAFSALEARRVAGGRTFATAVADVQPWSALVLVPAALAVLGGFGAYAVATWRMTVRQRAVGRRALAAAPAVYAGRVPKRVRRRRPAALAGYELPMALLGFPGVGWLFAGFPFTAAILLLVGPVLAWAVIPAAFSPYGTGPLRGVGWKFEFVWLAATALLSAAALYRAHRRRRLRIAGRRPPSSRKGYRTRAGVAIGAILLVLVSLPFVPAVAGIGGSSVRYAYQTRFTREVTGQFLSTSRGTVSLFAWRDPQARYPPDALRVRSSDVRSLLARAAAVDSPDAYRLFDLDHGRRVPLALRSSSPTQLRFAPLRQLPPGRYLFVGTHQGMFGGRDFAYFAVVAPAAPVTALSSGKERSVPQIASSFLPVGATLLAAAFAFLLIRSFLRRPAGQKALWAGGFTLFAVAAASEALAQRAGWSPGLFRTYYLAGGVLTVAYLGSGSAWMLLPRRARDALLGALGVATAAAVAAVLLAPVDISRLVAAQSGEPPPNAALGGHAFLWAIALNSLGTLFLVGGSLLSIVRRQRVRANVWIACGAIIVAAATGMSRTGDTSLVYLGELVGIALMFCGFTLTAPAKRPARAVEPAPQAAVLAR